MKSIVAFGVVALAVAGCRTTVGASNSVTASDGVYAAETKFSCATTRKVEGGKAAKFSFAVKNVSDAEAIEYSTREGMESLPVKTGEKSGLAALNADGSVALEEENGKEVLVLHGDDISIVIAHVALYKNSGYKQGYARIDMDEGTTGTKGWYSPVRCKVSPEIAGGTDSEDRVPLAEFDLTRPDKFGDIEVNLLDDGTPHGFSGAAVKLPGSPADIKVKGPKVEGVADCKMEPLHALSPQVTLMKVHAEITAEEGTCSFQINVKDGRKATLQIQAIGT